MEIMATERNAVKARRIKMYPNLCYSMFLFFPSLATVSTMCFTVMMSADELSCFFTAKQQYQHSTSTEEHGAQQKGHSLKVVELMSNCMRQSACVSVCLVSVVICSSVGRRAAYY